MDHRFIWAFHVLAVGPLLMYSGKVGYDKVKEQHLLFGLLGFIGFVVFLYHGYKLLSSMSKN